MTTTSEFDAWNAGDAYEVYMGRWSRGVARDFLKWVAPAPGLNWLDVGCGTGALTATVLETCAPQSICAVDPSETFVAHARDTISDARASFDTAGGTALPFDDGRFDIVTSGLVLNFIDDQVAALKEFRRVLRPAGTLTFYVWDYPGGGMGMIDAFWKAADALDPAAVALDESARFPGCTHDGMAQLCTAAGLKDPEIKAIETTSEFPDFDAFWQPFTLGAGPAPGYCKALSPPKKDRLKSELQSRLGLSGPIRLPARAWAVSVRLPA